MKRRVRAIVSFIILLFLWGTFLAGPFRYFGWMTRNVGASLLNLMGASGGLQALIAYVFSILCMVGLILLGRTGGRNLICAICAISSLCFYVIESFQTVKVKQAIPLFIAVGLALALIAAVMKTETFELWLADLFVLGIPVMIVYDALLVPIFSFLKLDTGVFAPYIEIPDTSMFLKVDLLNWPVLIWGVLITALALVPVIFLMASGSKGK